MSKIGKSIQSFLPPSSTRVSREEAVSKTNANKDWKEVRTTYDTDRDGRADTLVIREYVNGENTYTSMSKQDNGAISEGRTVIRGGTASEVEGIADFNGDGKVDYQTERLKDGQVGYMDHRDSNYDGMVDRRFIRTGLVDGQNFVSLGSTELEDTDNNGNFDKKTVSIRDFLTAGGVVPYDPDAEGILIDRPREESVDLPLDTLPKKEGE